MIKANAMLSESEGEKEQIKATPVTYKPVAYQKELIEHLSSEIDTHTKMIFDWRARAAFYWLVGPFVAIGSVVIITKQVPTFSSLGRAGANRGNYRLRLLHSHGGAWGENGSAYVGSM